MGLGAIRKCAAAGLRQPDIMMWWEAFISSAAVWVECKSSAAYIAFHIEV
jgi:hypothetical protein